MNYFCFTAAGNSFFPHQILFFRPLLQSKHFKGLLMSLKTFCNLCQMSKSSSKSLILNYVAVSPQNNAVYGDRQGGQVAWATREEECDELYILKRMRKAVQMLQSV